MTDVVIWLLGGSELELDAVSDELYTKMEDKLDSNCECHFRLVEAVCVCESVYVFDGCL